MRARPSATILVVVVLLVAACAGSPDPVVPDDLAERGRQYDAQRLGGVAVELKSHLPIERQARVIGATWLDQQLIGGGSGLGDLGFGGEAKQAIIDAGGTVRQLDADQRQAWVDAMKPVWAEFTEDVGQENIDAAQAINNMN